MSNLLITKETANFLLAMEKYKEQANDVYAPHKGEFISVPLVSADGQERFLFDYRKGKKSTKITYLHRSGAIVKLARVDFGVGHRNPDGTKVGSPHIHLYDEEHHDKIAYPLPADIFSKLDDPDEVLKEFIAFCNIKDLYFNNNLL